MLSASNRFLKRFVTIWYLVIATNVVGVAQGCACQDQAHEHDAASMAVMMEQAAVDCTGDGPEGNHIGIQNWESYLPAPEFLLTHSKSGQIYTASIIELRSLSGQFTDKIPI